MTHLKRRHAADLQLLAADQVGRPDDSQVLRRHARVVAVGRDPGQVADQVLQRPGRGKVR